MECSICGAQISDNSVYCRKCGVRIQYSREELDSKVMDYIQKLDENNKVILDNNNFKKIKITYSSLDSKNFENLLEIRGGELYFNCENEEWIKLMMELIVNELDSLQNGLVGIHQELHNDRVAQIETGWQIYKRALRTQDKNRKQGDLIYASNMVIESLNEIKKEMNGTLEILQKIPKNRIKKLFCGISLQEAQKRLQMIQESIMYYLFGTRLLMVIYSEQCEREAILDVINSEKKYIKNFCENAGYKRLLQIDDDNEEKWKERIRNFRVDMKVVFEKLETNVVSIEVEGEC